MTNALELLTTKQLISAQKKSLRKMVRHMHGGYPAMARDHQRDAEMFGRELDRRQEAAFVPAGMDDERRMVLKRLRHLNPQGIGTGNPNYPTSVLKGVCDLLEGRA